MSKLFIFIPFNKSNEKIAVLLFSLIKEHLNIISFILYFFDNLYKVLKSMKDILKMLSLSSIFISIIYEINVIKNIRLFLGFY